MAGLAAPGALLPRFLSLRPVTMGSVFNHVFAPVSVSPGAFLGPLLSPLGQILANLFPPFLLAVPKKKTSHSKKRSRRLAGKALKDVTALDRCTGCGRMKRKHILCAYCVQNIKDLWAGKIKPKTTTDSKA